MDTTTLFVWGFNAEVEEAELSNLVSNNGEESIVSVSIERDEMQNSLGRARVVFRNREDAEAAAICAKANPLCLSLESFPEPSQVNSLGRGSSVVINPEHADQEAMALSLRNPIYMPLYSFPEWEGSTSQVNSSQEWTIPMTQVPTSLHNPLGSSMYRNPHAQLPVPLLNPLGSSMYRNPHAQEPMMQHVPLLNPLGSSMHRNPHAQGPMIHHVPQFNPLGSSMFRNPHAQGPMMHHVPQLNLLGSSMFRNPHAQEPMMHHVPLFNPLGSSMFRNPQAQEPVRHHVPHLQWRNQIRDGMARKLILYVCNFSYELEEAGLKNMFLPFGVVTSCKIVRCKVTGRSRGCGYVHFSTTEDAQRAATALNGQFFDDRQIWVSFARVKSEVLIQGSLLV